MQAFNRLIILLLLAHYQYHKQLLMIIWVFHHRINFILVFCANPHIANQTNNYHLSSTSLSTRQFVDQCPFFVHHQSACSPVDPCGNFWSTCNHWLDPHKKQIPKLTGLIKLDCYSNQDTAKNYWWFIDNQAMWLSWWLVDIAKWLVSWW